MTLGNLECSIRRRVVHDYDLLDAPLKKDAPEHAVEGPLLVERRDDNTELGFDLSVVSPRGSHIR